MLAQDFRNHAYAGPGRFDALLDCARVSGELSAVEMTLRWRDGLQVMFAAKPRTQWGEPGAVTGFEATMLEIGELKLADRQRRSGERRFRHLFRLQRDRIHGREPTTGQPGRGASEAARVPQRARRNFRSSLILSSRVPSLR